MVEGLRAVVLGFGYLLFYFGDFVHVLLVQGLFLILMSLF